MWFWMSSARQRVAPASFTGAGMSPFLAHRQMDARDADRAAATSVTVSSVCVMVSVLRWFDNGQMETDL